MEETKTKQLHPSITDETINEFLSNLSTEIFTEYKMLRETSKIFSIGVDYRINKEKGEVYNTLGFYVDIKDLYDKFYHKSNWNRWCRLNFTEYFHIGKRTIVPLSLFKPITIDLLKKVRLKDKNAAQVLINSIELLDKTNQDSFKAIEIQLK